MTEARADANRKYARHILVTGGAGFIGSHLVIRLVKNYPDYYVINFDKLDYCSSLVNLKGIEDYPNYKFIRGDICNPEFVWWIFKEEQVDTVLHLAAESHVEKSFWNPLDFSYTNVFGSHVMVTTAHKFNVKLFVHVSTDEVYGGLNVQVLNEDDQLNPTNPYAATKAAAECVVMSYWRTYKVQQPQVFSEDWLTTVDKKLRFPIIVTRANNVYGPHQYPEKVIPKFISLLERDKKLCIHGEGSAIRNFLYVSDVVSAFDVILHRGSPGEVYNIGCEFEISVLNLAKFLIQKMKGLEGEDKNAYLDFVEDRVFNDLRYPMDYAKVTKLGWLPRVKWEDGIEATIAWYKENFHNWNTADAALVSYPTFQRNSFNNYEISRKILNNKNY